MNRKTFLLSASALAALPPPFSPFGQPFARQLTIGVNVPQSGPHAAGGFQIADGVKAAIDEANFYAPNAPTVFAIRIFDDRDDTSQAIANVQFAASDPSLLAIVGGFDATLLEQTLPTYAADEMPLLVSASTDDAITGRGYRNVWRLPTKDSTEGRLFARFAASRERPKMALAISQDGRYGPDVARGFVDQMKAQHIASDEYVFPQRSPDFAAAAREALTKSPDLIYLCGETAKMGGIAPALRAAGYAGRLGASEGFYNTLTLGQPAAAMHGALVSSSFPPLGRLASASSQLRDFEAHYAVTALSAFAYAAAQIIIAAAQRIGAASRLAMLSALQAPVSYDTIVGSFQFSALGDPIDPNVYFYSVGPKAFTFVAPAHPTNALL